MVRLMPAAESALLWIIIDLTWLIAAAALVHMIGSTAEVFYLVFAGRPPCPEVFWHYLGPVLAGNIAGGRLIFTPDQPHASAQRYAVMLHLVQVNKPFLTRKVAERLHRYTTPTTGVLGALARGQRRCIVRERNDQGHRSSKSDSDESRSRDLAQSWIASRDQL